MIFVLLLLVTIINLKKT